MTSPDELSNPRAEMALLGTLVRAKPELRVQMVMRIREEWFTGADRVAAWQVIHDMVNRSLPIDTTLLDDSLKAKLGDAVRAALVNAIITAMPTAALWETLATRVEDYYTRRKGVEACREAMARFADLKVPAAEALESAESELFGLHNLRAGKGMQHVGAFLVEAVSQIEEAVTNRGYVIGGLPTGLTDVDRRYIQGMRPGHIFMIAAEPGGGKTVAMMEIACNVAMGEADYDEATRAREKGFPNYQANNVGIYTLEMDGASLAKRSLIGRSKIQLNKMQRGMVNNKEKEELARAARQLLDSRLFIEHVPGISIQELRVKARYDVQRHGLKLICIDYAQIITSSSKAARGNRTQEMLDVSQGLDLLAEECGVPVIVLAQTKQEFWGKRANTAALAETSQLAKDADFIGLLGFWDVIEGQKKKKGPPGEKNPWDGPDEDEEDDEPTDPGDPSVYAYLDIVKNRHGPNTQGQMPIKLRWERDFYEFISTTKRLYDSTGKETEH